MVRTARLCSQLMVRGLAPLRYDSLVGYSVHLRSSHQSDEVALWAHIGGVAAGAILALVMRRPGVPLFDRRLDTARN